MDRAPLVGHSYGGWILDTKAARQRARRLLENLEIEIIEGASHALIMEQPGQVNRQVLQFLKP